MISSLNNEIARLRAQVCVSLNLTDFLISKEIASEHVTVAS